MISDAMLKDFLAVPDDCLHSYGPEIREIVMELLTTRRALADALEVTLMFCPSSGINQYIQDRIKIHKETLKNV